MWWIVSRCNTSAIARSSPTRSASARACRTTPSQSRSPRRCSAPSPRSSQPCPVRADDVAERGERPLGDLHRLRDPDTPGQLVHHRPRQPADLLDCRAPGTDRAPRSSCAGNRPSGPRCAAPARAVRAAPRGRLVAGRDESQGLLELDDGVLERGRIEGPPARDTRYRARRPGRRTVREGQVWVRSPACASMSSA